MPKRMRRRLLTPGKKKLNDAKQNSNDVNDTVAEEEIEKAEAETPRGRLQGALKDVLDPGDESDDDDSLLTPMKRNIRVESPLPSTSSSEGEREGGAGRAWRGGGGAGRARARAQSPQRYVLKLFDRSVDLSQFAEDSPLYPICRAWIANQPRVNYNKFGKRKSRRARALEPSVELPGPAGAPVPRAPDLLPEQLAASKDNIDLDYRSAPPTRAALLGWHAARWAGVRRAWLQQAARREARYKHAQKLLYKIYASAI